MTLVIWVYCTDRKYRKYPLIVIYWRRWNFSCFCLQLFFNHISKPFNTKLQSCYSLLLLFTVQQYLSILSNSTSTLHFVLEAARREDRKVRCVKTFNWPIKSHYRKCRSQWWKGRWAAAQLPEMQLKLYIYRETKELKNKWGFLRIQNIETKNNEIL